ncbi:MAG: hypothetical protein WCF85_11840 [Rhodospirillaceae bacterium]
MATEASLPEDRQTEFVVDKATAKAISGLRQKFGATSNAEVIRKALNLARVVAEYSAGDNSVVISSKDKEKLLIKLSE